MELQQKSHLERFGTPYIWIRTSYLKKNGEWETDHYTKPKIGYFCSEEFLNTRWSESHPYLYILKDGIVQNCTAKIYVEEREWIHEETAERKVSKDINVEFTAELGIEAGSWKGGVVGCNYQMHPNETPLMTLRRMERERTF